MSRIFDRLLGRRKASPQSAVSPKAHRDAPAHAAPWSEAPAPPEPPAPEPPAGAGLADFFIADHRGCDEIWASVEDAEDAGQAAACFHDFEQRLRHHLAMEEEVLFPEFEAATGMTGGPTAMMRIEHEQMRGLLDAMGDAADGGDQRGLLDQGDTLLMLIQQHNMKEEQMLYPMIEQAIGRLWADRSEGSLRARLTS